MHRPLFIKKIWQKDNYRFSIEWNDGEIQDFLLCNVQRHCPCALCTDEATGNRLVDPHSIPDNLRAISIKSVGRYALRIQFSSGCSTGIYTYERLKQMSGEKTCLKN